MKLCARRLAPWTLFAVRPPPRGQFECRPAFELRSCDLQVLQVLVVVPLHNPTYSGTMTVIVNAAPEHIWTWLVQIGYRRGGLYTYDWLDRLFGYLDRPSAIRILPEFQNLAVGDEIPLGRGPSWAVAAIERNRALVLDMRNLGSFDWVWQFGLYTLDENRTQLVSHSCVRTRSVWARLATSVIEPAGFLMTRRMLLGLKQRAEAWRAANMGEIRANPRAAA